MKEILEDIREKLRNGFYQNEEHVRLSLVARVVQALGWDIWNPKEVNTEFVAVPTEDRTKVDMALFADAFAPSVFIEIKGVGGIKDLPGIERQLRDYNRNITAPFTIITDGAKWRFYYSRAAGEFSAKCFKCFDLLSDDLADIESALADFLQKGAIVADGAEEQAKTLLKLSQKQRVMEECLPKARRMVQDPPFLSLPEALIRLVAERGFNITTDEAFEFIGKPPRIDTSTERPDPGDRRTVQPPVLLRDWFRRKNVAESIQPLIEQLIECLQGRDKNVSYKLLAALRFYDPKRHAISVYPRKSGLHLHVYTGGQLLGEIKPLSGIPWGSITLHNQNDLDRALPWLAESLARIRRA